MSDGTVTKSIASGTAFVDLSSWRKIAVSGTDARPWLNDLVSADISDLEPGAARRSLLLSPTGRIRAEFTVSMRPDTVLLLQDPEQPASVLDLLARYVLSSDVQLDDRTLALALLSLPGRTSVPDMAGVRVSAPSCVGTGVDLLCDMEAHNGVVESLAEHLALADTAALEAWRVSVGIPRFGVDAREDDLPQEAGLGDAVAFDKGCYLGQEAVAKVRNLGHPRRTLLHLEASSEVRPGETVESGERPVGEITSAGAVNGRWRALVRVRWEAREAPLATADGVALPAVTSS